MELTLTQEHIALAKQLGACSVDYEPGTPVSEIASDDLAWFAERAPEVATKITEQLSASADCVGVIPLPLFGSGDGYGSWDGDGYGYGSGSGDGYGDGYGYGSGYGR